MGRFRLALPETGQAVTELALLLPLFVFGLIGAADLARALGAQLALQNAARAGAEAGVLGAAPTDDTVAAYARGELGRVPGLNPNAASVSVSRWTDADGARLVTVGVRYTFTTIVPWPLVPSAVPLDRATTMRNIR